MIISPYYQHLSIQVLFQSELYSLLQDSFAQNLKNEILQNSRVVAVRATFHLSFIRRSGRCDYGDQPTSSV